MGQHQTPPRVQSHFHHRNQFFLTGSAVRSRSICRLRFCPWFELQLSGYRHFFFLSNCLLTSPVLKVGNLQKLFLPKSTWILPLILLGLEIVSIAPSCLFTNYCIEAKSSVLLSITQFPDTFFCQTGFLNILNLHLGVFSCTFYTGSVSPLKNHIQLWVRVLALSHKSWPPKTASIYFTVTHSASRLITSYSLIVGEAYQGQEWKKNGLRYTYRHTHIYKCGICSLIFTICCL